MKTIFLDVDGVLNGEGPHNGKILSIGRYELKLSCVRMLFEIQRKTGAEIVLSSTWRNKEDGLRLLSNVGIEFSSVTPNLSSRYKELKHYIDHHPVGRYLILDDCVGIKELSAHAIHTNPTCGLTPAQVYEAIAYLNGQISSLIASGEDVVYNGQAGWSVYRRCGDFYDIISEDGVAIEGVHYTEFS